jgi:predicted DNA-binding antitoxin AbrB/MazE fold protein
MNDTVLAIVKDGKIEPLSPIDFPDGTRLSVTINDNIEIGEWTEDEWLNFSKQGRSYLRRYHECEWTRSN